MTRLKAIVWGVSGLFAAVVPVYLFAYVIGPDPRRTAAPGDDALACATAGCHTGNPKGGPINAFGGSVNATFSSGNFYTPGSGPITITVSVSDPVNTHYGFQMTARLESDLANGQAGDFTAGENQIVLCDDGSPKLPKGCPANAKVQFIEHAFPSTNSSASTTPYTFTWTPPATNVGPVHFYIAGNAVNNNRTNDPGDHVYTNSYVLGPVFQCTNTTKPVITAAHSAKGFGRMANFAPGSWLEIEGTNLASTTRQWQGYDFNGVNAPTTIDGVSATVNGKSAFIFYAGAGDVSPTQVNIQAPADTANGPVQITVKNCNATSDPFTVTENPVVPGLLATDLFKINGKQYLVSTFPDFVTYVGNAGLVPNFPYTFRPAKPNDTIVLYGIGFGAVNPSFAPGIIVTASNQLADQVTVLFDQTPATVTYRGLGQNLVGIYQFNIVVPNVPDGDYPINVTVGSIKAQPSPAYLTVRR